jgi:hypothetical protein
MRRALSEAERAGLAAFEARRAAFEAGLTASNVVHHKHTCPVCGFPTLDRRLDYLVCVLCLWEDGTAERDPWVARPPNSEALGEARIRISRLLAECGLAGVAAAATDAVVRDVRRFEAGLRSGAMAIAEEFARHVRAVVPSLFG